MKAFRTSLLLMIFLMISCGKRKSVASSDIETLSINKLQDSLLRKAKSSDSLLYRKEKPFFFFKSGFIFNQNSNNAISIYSLDSSTYIVNRYVFVTAKDKFFLIDSVSIPLLNTGQFDILIQDYNFDGHNDLYIQETASNGWSISRGCLIIIDPETEGMKFHPETREFGNMAPDSSRQLVKSESFEGYNADGSLNLLIHTNKWMNGKLIEVGVSSIAIE